MMAHDVHRTSLSALCIALALVAIAGPCLCQNNPYLSLDSFNGDASGSYLAVDLGTGGFYEAFAVTSWESQLAAFELAGDNSSKPVIIVYDGQTVDVAITSDITSVIIDMRAVGNPVFTVTGGRITLESVDIYGGAASVAGGVVHVSSGRVELTQVHSIGASAAVGGFMVSTGGLVMMHDVIVEGAVSRYGADVLLVGGDGEFVGERCHFSSEHSVEGIVVATLSDASFIYSCDECVYDGVSVNIQSYNITGTACDVGLSAHETFVRTGVICETVMNSPPCSHVDDFNGIVIDYDTCDYACSRTLYKDADGMCVPCTVCGENEETLSLCTATTDAVCEPLTLCPDVVGKNGIRTSDEDCSYVCQSEQYMNATGHCVACTTCDGVQVALSPCSSSSDTVCSSCATPPTNGVIADYASCSIVCSAGHYEAENGDCSVCNACGAGQVEVSGCNATQDTICADCVVPANALMSSFDTLTNACLWTCLSGYYQTDADACAQCSPCEPGQLMLSPCSGTQDTVCTTCHLTAPPNSFFVGFDATAGACEYECDVGFFLDGETCTACTVCTTEQIYGGGCSGPQDTICTPCSRPMHAVYSSLNSCAYVCASGYVWNAANSSCDECQPPTGSQAVDVAMCTFVCPPGTLLDESSNECLTCAGVNMFLNGDTGSCETCSVCGADALQVSPCNATHDTACMECGVDNVLYMAQGNCSYVCPHETYLNTLSMACEACTSPCGEGYAEVQTCTMSTDRMCVSCPQVPFSRLLCAPSHPCQFECVEGFTYSEEAQACVDCTLTGGCADGYLLQPSVCTNDTVAGVCVLDCPDGEVELSGLCHPTLFMDAHVYYRFDQLNAGSGQWNDLSVGARHMLWTSSCSPHWGDTSSYTVSTSTNGLFEGVGPTGTAGCFLYAGDAFSNTNQDFTFMMVAEVSSTSGHGYSDTWMGISSTSTDGATGIGWSVNPLGFHTWAGPDEVGEGASGLASGGVVAFFRIEDNVAVSYYYFDPASDDLQQGYYSTTNAFVPYITTEIITLFQFPRGTHQGHGVPPTSSGTPNLLGEAAMWLEALSVSDMLVIGRSTYNRLASS